MTLPMKPALWCPGFRQGHPLARGLIAAWPWAGTANLRDVVGNYHMTAYNNSTVVPDEFGRVLALDDGSNQYVKRATPVTGYPYSMGCWFKSDDAIINQVLMSITHAGADYYGGFLEASGAEGGDPVRFGRAYTTIAWASTTTGYSANTWHHALGVHGGRFDGRVFIDGGSKGVNTASKTVINWAQFFIGSNRTDGYTSGRIALPLFWNRILTDLEVRWLYEEPWSLITPRKRTYFWVAASPAGAPPTGNPWWYYAQMAG